MSHDIIFEYQWLEVLNLTVNHNPQTEIDD